MEQTISPVRRVTGVLMVLALIVGVALSTLAGSGQKNSNQEEKVKIEDAVEHQGDRVRARPGFELFAKGNKVYARRYGATSKASPSVDGYITCTCAGDGDCTTYYNFNTKEATCNGSGSPPCSHCTISYRRGD
ncbi:MAG: hypothetical protein M3362_07905 [Acidobacteriota bacterium]|nr:hypothetical protein [Acidobacteriota bacterium]